MAARTPNTIKFVLKKPVPVDGGEVSELTVRTDMTAGDLMAGDGAKGDIGRVVLIAAELAGVPPSTIKAMDAGDFMRLSEKLGPLLGSGLPTQGT